MNDEEKKKLNDWLVYTETRIHNDLIYWSDQLRLCPHPSTATAYAGTLIRFDVYEEYRNAILALLDS